jgi:hypothetical protein
MTDSPASWLATNLEALATALGTAVTVSGDGRWLVTAGPDGPVLQLRTAGGALVAAHSRRQPAAEAVRLVDHALGGRACPPFAMVIGAGLGASVQTLLDRDASVRVLVIEPDPSGAAALLGHRDWTAAIAAGRLLVLVGAAFRGAERAWRFVPTSEAAPVVVVHPVLAREYPDDVRRAAAVGTRVLGDARANAGAEAALAGPYLLNTVANLGVIAREGDVEALADAFAGVPAIVCAAGPSLDRVVADVARLADRALVIAVDTALRPLLAHGVAPHFAVAVDPSERNARHLAGLTGVGDTWLVGESAVHPTAFPAFAGRTFVFRVGDNHPWPWLAAHGVHRGTLAAWGSVLVSALDLAISTGARPIAIVGADLAYTGRQPYCRGTAFEEDWAREVRMGERLTDVWARVIDRAGAQEKPDVHGRPVPTLPHLVAFRDRLLDQVAECGLRIVNATDGGILHGGGLHVASLDTVIDHLKPSGDLRIRIRERYTESRVAVSDSGQPAGVLAGVLARPDTASALTRLVPDLDGQRIAASIAHGRAALAAPTIGTPIGGGPEATLDAPLWLPEQTAALAALDAPAAAELAPLVDTAEPTTLDALVEALRDLLAHEPLVAGPVDTEALGPGLLALPLPLLISLAATSQPAASRLGATLTRWIAATASDVGPPDASFWATPAAAIDLPEDAQTSTRSDDELARIAAVTTVAWAVGRRRAAPATASRVAASIARSWPRVTREMPRVARVRLALRDTEGADVQWIDNVSLGSIARPLSGTIIRARAGVGAGRRVNRLTLSVRLDIESDGAWTPAGESIVTEPSRLLSPEPCARSLYAASIDDSHAVLTRQDGTGSSIIDAAGTVTTATTIWPGRILAEGPLNAAGEWFAWSMQPPRLLVRDAAGRIVHDLSLPFTPISAEVASGGLHFAALDGVWHWTASDGVGRVIETPPLIAAWSSAGGGLDLAVLPPQDRPRMRVRRHLTWSPREGLRERDAPPLGPCWSRSTHDGWTAEAYPDANLVRISDPAGVRGWVITDYPRTVTWAGGSLVIVITGGLVSFVPAVRDGLS